MTGSWALLVPELVADTRPYFAKPTRGDQILSATPSLLYTHTYIYDGSSGPKERVLASIHEWWHDGRVLLKAEKRETKIKSGRVSHESVSVRLFRFWGTPPAPLPRRFAAWKQMQLIHATNAHVTPDPPTLPTSTLYTTRFSYVCMYVCMYIYIRDKI